MKEKIKIIFLLVISFFIVTNLSPSIFIANTPRINRQFLTKLRDFPTRFLSLASQIGGSRKPEAVNLSNIPLNKVSQGVYAGETAELKYVKIIQSEISWQEIELKTKSGRVVKLRYPKGQPPTKEMLNIIKSE